jgi:cytochrome b subunit of formate dehydrogenase
LTNELETKDVTFSPNYKIVTGSKILFYLDYIMATIFIIAGVIIFYISATVPDRFIGAWISVICFLCAYYVAKH